MVPTQPVATSVLCSMRCTHPTPSEQRWGTQVVQELGGPRWLSLMAPACRAVPRVGWRVPEPERPGPSRSQHVARPHRNPARGHRPRGETHGTTPGSGSRSASTWAWPRMPPERGGHLPEVTQPPGGSLDSDSSGPTRKPTLQSHQGEGQPQAPSRPHATSPLTQDGESKCAHTVHGVGALPGVCVPALLLST